MPRAASGGFTGILQVDGYAAYNRLARSSGINEGVTLAVCYAHVRRRFYELHVKEGSRLAPDRHHHGRAVGDRGRHPRLES
ncbi:transposase [Bradyrhizobium sp. CNPSo 4019]|uniref:Transposase n=1 Tax=Bradyrhizobium diversitatis TaxID=2755406 RepID=A0ABS0PC86_9BRAD|nr:transposase [Bradyrhizobium diversitatis]